jgi:hypothetical protein
MHQQNQGLLVAKLKSSLRMFYCYDLAKRYGINLCDIWPWICSVYRRHNIILILFFPLSWLITEVKKKKRITLMEQELITTPEHLSSPRFNWWGSCCSFCPITTSSRFYFMLWCPVRFLIRLYCNLFLGGSCLYLFTYTGVQPLCVSSTISLSDDIQKMEQEFLTLPEHLS